MSGQICNRCNGTGVVFFGRCVPCFKCRGLGYIGRAPMGVTRTAPAVEPAPIKSSELFYLEKSDPADRNSFRTIWQFKVCGERVELQELFYWKDSDGCPASDTGAGETMNREQARRRYAALLVDGFVKPA